MLVLETYYFRVYFPSLLNNRFFARSRSRRFEWLRGGFVASSTQSQSLSKSLSAGDRRRRAPQPPPLEFGVDPRARRRAPSQRRRRHRCPQLGRRSSRGVADAAPSAVAVGGELSEFGCARFFALYSILLCHSEIRSSGLEQLVRDAWFGWFSFVRTTTCSVSRNFPCHRLLMLTCILKLFQFYEKCQIQRHRKADVQLCCGIVVCSISFESTKSSCLVPLSPIETICTRSSPKTLLSSVY